MFTGIIEEIGIIEGIQWEGGGVRLSLKAGQLTEDMSIGDSLAVSGPCLTVTGISGERVDVEAVEETVRRTTIGTSKTGDRVNLERALRSTSRLGGHMVTGHIDGVGRIIDRSGDTRRTVFTFQIPEGLNRFMVEKGSLAVDGISLTITAVFGSRVTVAVIPHTEKMTTLSLKKVGDAVNIEADILGKYVARMIGPATTGLTEEWFREKGF